MFTPSVLVLLASAGLLVEARATQHFHGRRHLQGVAALNKRADSLTLDSTAVQVGSQNDGSTEIGNESFEALSAVSDNNFINFCEGKTLTNGLQITTGSCNGIVMGDIPAKTSMVSSIITFPVHGSATIESDTSFNITVQMANLVAGSFTNADSTYYAAPQALSGGQVVGHTHVVIQDMGSSLNPTAALDATQFAFFKGINDAGNGKGLLSAAVTGGLPAGNYRICTMASSSNHQPVLMPVAQRGPADDCSKFTVIGSGTTINSAANNGAGGIAAAAAAASAVAAGPDNTQAPVASSSSVAASSSVDASSSVGKGAGKGGKTTSSSSVAASSSVGKGVGKGGKTTSSSSVAASSSVAVSSSTDASSSVGKAGKGGKTTSSSPAKVAETTSSSVAAATTSKASKATSSSSAKASASSGSKSGSGSGAGLGSGSGAKSSTGSSSGSGSSSSSGSSQVKIIVTEIISFFEFSSARGGSCPEVSKAGEAFAVAGQLFQELEKAAAAACGAQFSACVSFQGAGFSEEECVSQQDSCSSAASSATTTPATPATVTASIAIPATTSLSSTPGSVIAVSTQAPTTTAAAVAGSGDAVATQSSSLGDSDALCSVVTLTTTVAPPAATDSQCAPPSTTTVTVLPTITPAAGSNSTAASNKRRF